MNGPRPRVASSRVGEAEKTARRSEYSPRLPENIDARPGTSSPKGLHREFSNASERRTERTVITTREKVQVKTRNPVKESANAGNRGDWDKSRVKKNLQPESGTPQLRKKEEPVEGQ
jgi:gamma-tubulin complex component 2